MSTHDPGRKPSYVATGFLVAAGVVLWLALWTQVLLLTPPLKKQFDEFGLQLPWLTKQVVGLANLAWDNWWLSVPAALVGALAWGGLVGGLRHRAGWAAAVTLIAALMLAALTAANLVVAAGLFLPEIKLREALSK